MKTFAIACTAVIFALALAVSFSHTLALANLAGIVGWEAVAVAIMSELAFSFGAVSLLFRTAPKRSAMAVFLLGTGVVVVANLVHGLAFGPLGIFIALLIPAMILAGEQLLRGTLAHFAKASEAASQPSEAVAKPVAEPVKECEAASQPASQIAQAASHASQAIEAPLQSSEAAAKPREVLASELRGDGVPVAQIAERFEVSTRTVYNWTRV